MDSLERSDRERGLALLDRTMAVLRAHGVECSSSSGVVSASLDYSDGTSEVVEVADAWEFLGY